jgi:hypothetical protein
MCPAAYLKGNSDAGIPTYRFANPQCTGKVRFESAVIANRAAKRKKHRAAYRCELCGCFHVGADTVEPVKKFKASLILNEAERK